MNLLNATKATLRAVLKYGMPERDPPYGKYPVSLTRTNNNNQEVKISKSIPKYDGDKAFLFLFIRDTIPRFEKVATECAWTDEETFSYMLDDVLEGKAKNKWEEALEEGNGPGQPIDPENPDPDDFDMTVSNFCAGVAEQEWPGNDVLKYLQALKYEQVLETFAHQPTDFLRERMRIEKWRESLPTIIGTEPSEELLKEELFTSFEEKDQEWFEKVDNSGKNNRRTMSRLEIAKLFDARMIE